MNCVNVSSNTTVAHGAHLQSRLRLSAGVEAIDLPQVYGLTSLINVHRHWMSWFLNCAPSSETIADSLSSIEWSADIFWTFPRCTIPTTSSFFSGLLALLLIPSIHPSTHSPTNSSIHPHINPFIHPSTHLHTIHPSIHPPTHSSRSGWVDE